MTAVPQMRAVTVIFERAARDQIPQDKLQHAEASVAIESRTLKNETLKERVWLWIWRHGAAKRAYRRQIAQWFRWRYIVHLLVDLL